MAENNMLQTGAETILAVPTLLKLLIHLKHEFFEVFALEKHHEHLGKGFNSFDHVFPSLEFEG